MGNSVCAAQQLEETDEERLPNLLRAANLRSELVPALEPKTKIGEEPAQTPCFDDGCPCPPMDSQEPTVASTESRVVTVSGLPTTTTMCPDGSCPAVPTDSMYVQACSLADRNESRRIFVVVNGKSGGSAASQFLTIPKEGYQYCEGTSKALVFAYDVRDKQCYEHLAAAVAAAASSERLLVIVAGGDGTVMWVIEELFNAEISIEKLAIGTVPFGTGNDFANVTRWGSTGPSGRFLKEQSGWSGLRSFVRHWLQAECHNFDIWELSIKTRASSNACFHFIEDSKKVCTDAHIERHHIKTLPGGEQEMSKYMCNYFSFGLDARVGVGFDKHRTTSQLGNKAVYAFEGIKKLVKQKGVVANVMEDMKELSAELPLGRADRGHDAADCKDDTTIFTTSRDKDLPQIKGNPVSMVFMNIPSIAAGLDIWRYSSKKMGTTGSSELLKAEQNFGDGRIECLAYRSCIGFALERLKSPKIFSGRGGRVHSGKGPYRLTFKDPSSAEYRQGTDHCKGRIYMQVDGEYFIVHDLSSVVLRHHRAITVLVGNGTPDCRA